MQNTTKTTTLTSSTELEATRRENRLRASAKRNGLAMRTSRQRESIDNLGGYMLVDISRNLVISGSRFDLSLDDVESYLEGLAQ